MGTFPGGGLQAPTAPVTLGYQLRLGAAALGFSAASAPVLSLLIPGQIDHLAPSRVATYLAAITALGALVALVANVMAGALSDRTRSRHGRRRPWIVGGVVLAAAGLLAASHAPSVAVLAATWVAVQLGTSAAGAASAALVPETIPPSQFGSASAILALAFPLAILIGSVVAGVLLRGAGPSYLALATVMVVLAAPLLAIGRAWSPAWVAAPRRTGRDFASSLWVNPRRHPDYALAFVTRFLLVLGYDLGVGSFLFLYVEKVLRYPQLFPGHTVKEGVATLMIIGVLALVPVALVAGPLSDRTGKRKVFVMASSVLIGVSLGLMSLFHSWPVAQVAAGLIGAGFGAYLAVDSALITQVLPSLADCGKDLGLMNMANILPPILSPVAAGFLVNAFGQDSPTGYRALFVIGGLLSVASGLLVRRIRGVN